MEHTYTCPFDTLIYNLNNNISIALYKRYMHLRKCLPYIINLIKNMAEKKMMKSQTFPLSR